MTKAKTVYANGEKFIRAFVPFISSTRSTARKLGMLTEYSLPHNVKIYGSNRISNGVHMLSTLWGAAHVKIGDKHVPMVGTQWYISEDDIVSLAHDVERTIMETEAYSEYLLIRSFNPESLHTDWQRWSSFGRIYIYSPELASYHNSRDWVKVSLPQPKSSQEELKRRYESKVNTSWYETLLCDDAVLDAESEDHIPF